MYKRQYVNFDSMEPYPNILKSYLILYVFLYMCKLTLTLIFFSFLFVFYMLTIVYYSIFQLNYVLQVFVTYFIPEKL